jgi:hypothetical protein
MAKSKKLQEKVIRNRIGLTRYPRVYAISKSLFSRYIKTLKVSVARRSSTNLQRVNFLNSKSKRKRLSTRLQHRENL